MVESSDEDYADDYDDEYSSESDSNNISNNPVTDIYERNKNAVTDNLCGRTDSPKSDEVSTKCGTSAQIVAQEHAYVNESNSNILLIEAKTSNTNDNDTTNANSSKAKPSTNEKATGYCNQEDNHSKKERTDGMNVNVQEETENTHHDNIQSESDANKREEKIQVETKQIIKGKNSSSVDLATHTVEDKKGKTTNDHLINGNDEHSLKFKIWEYSSQLVREGEKNVKLAQHLEQSREQIRILNENIDEIRLAMLYGIHGDVDISDIKDKYSNIPLVELLRLRLQSTSKVYTNYKSSKSKKVRRTQIDCINSLNDQHRQSAADGDLSGGDKSSNVNVMVQQKIPSDKSIKTSAKCNEEEISRLHQKIRRMVERSRQDRESRVKLEKDISIENERVEALSDHIEKLMIHLKHEAIAKAKALAERSRIQKEVELLKIRNQTMTKRNKRKDKAIMDLKEGSRILEDQLRLMDEKYMELRMKLDWTRIQTERLIKTKEEETRQLRAKFALMSDLGTHKTVKNTSNVLLDDYEFPSHKNVKKRSKSESKSKTTQMTMNQKEPEKGGIFLGKKLPSTDDAGVS